MLDSSPTNRRLLQQHDIEPAGPAAPMASRDKLRGETDQFLLFPFVHGMDRPPELLGPARLDLHEYQRRSVFRNQIELTQGGTEISREDPIAFSNQEGLRGRFSFLPKETPGVKDSH